MRRTPAAVRYLTLHRLAFCVTALTVLVTAAATAATAAFAADAATVGNRQTLTDNTSSSILVTANTSQFSSATATVEQTIARSAHGLPMTFTAAPQSDPLNLPAGRSGPRAQTLLLELAQLRQHARLVAGRWPTSVAGGAVQACLPVQAAKLLRLPAGATLIAHDSLSHTTVNLQVSCTFAEADPAGSYWQLDVIGTAAVAKAGGFTSYGPMVTTEPVASWPVQPSAGNWLAVPDFGAMTASNLSTLSASIGGALTGLANSSGISPVITTNLPTLLADQAVALEVSRSQLLIGELILLVIAGASLAVAVNLLASQRAGEPGLLMARGATRLQLATRGGTDAALLAIPAAIGGPLIGAWLAPLLARIGHIGSGSISLPGGLPMVAWIAGVLVAAGCAFIIALPWLRQPISPIQRRSGRARQKTITTALSSGADVALVLLAAGASWQLAHYSAPVSTGVTGAIGVDPVLVAAPVLALTAGTLIMLRLLPLFIRLTERMAARGRGITVATAAWMISRRTLRQAGPALLTVLAVATAVIALSDGTSWSQSVQAQAGFTVGADSRITLPAGAPLAIGSVGEITDSRGFQAATPVVRDIFSLPDNTQTTMLAVDPRQASAIVPLRHDLLIKPKSDPLGPIAGDSTAVGVQLPGRPVRLQVVAALTGHELGSATLTLQVSDAAGVSYELPAGTLVANGKSERMDLSISPGQRADYPLTLTGFNFGYQLPLFHPNQRAELAIESVRTVNANGAVSPATAPLGAAQALDLTALSPQLQPWEGKAAYGEPAGISLIPQGHRAVFKFITGAGSNAIDGPGFPVQAETTVSVTPQPETALPAIATSAFLSASGSHIGSIIQAGGLSEPVPVQIVGEVAQFPTINTPAGGLVVSQQALQTYMEANSGSALPVTEWWTRNTAQDSFPDLPAGSSVMSQAGVASSLSSEPLEVAPLRSLLAVAVVALVLAILGFLVSVSSSRERGRDLAVLDALGATPGQLARLLCLEQGMLSIPAAAGGLALGLLLSRLVIPAVTLTAAAAHPIPSVLVQVPLAPALAVAVLIAAAPVIVVAFSVLRGTGTVARLRAEEEM